MITLLTRSSEVVQGEGVGLEIWISGLSLFSSIVIPLLLQFLSNRRQDKLQEQQDVFQKETQDELEEFHKFYKEFSTHKQATKELQFELENRSNLIPYFHLNRTKSRIYLNQSNQLIVEIHLTNVGRGTATNIRTSPIKNELTDEDLYFKQDPFMGKVTHFLYDYFNENFAIPNASIFFSLKEINDNVKQLYFLCFEIKFNDAIGREYKQKFRFGYDNYIVKGINQDSTTYPPELVKDI